MVSVHRKPSLSSLHGPSRGNHIRSGSKPIALVVYPVSDHNGAFKRIKHDTATLHRHGYKVIYVKCAKDSQMFDAIRHAGQTREISVLYIGGHGTSDTTQFGGQQDIKGVSQDETDFLDRGDIPKMADLGQYVDEKGTIILLSCSTGSDGEDDLTNVANTLGKVFPGRKIYAPLYSSYNDVEVKFKKNKITDVWFRKPIKTAWWRPDRSLYLISEASRKYTYAVPMPARAHNTDLARYLKGADLHDVKLETGVTVDTKLSPHYYIGGPCIGDVVRLGRGGIDAGARLVLGSDTLSIDAVLLSTRYHFPLTSNLNPVSGLFGLHGGMGSAVNTPKWSPVAGATLGAEVFLTRIGVQASIGAQCSSGDRQCSALFTVGVQILLNTFVW